MSLKATNNVETNKYELEIEISAEKFEEGIQKAYQREKNKIQIAGFRKGKAPRKLIEREYGEEVFFETAVNILYPQEVDDAVKESGLEIVARPDVEITDISKADGVKIKATVITKPEVEISDYKGIEVEKEVKTVTDEDVDKQADSLREKNARVITVDDRAAEMGDDVVIDFEGFKDGVAFDGGKAEDFTLGLGSGQFIPGFEEQVAGHNIGEEFDINVSFPEDYQVEDLKGAPVVFKIKLKGITKKEIPELDDEMVKDATEFETVDEYKADVRKKLEEHAQHHAEHDVEDALMDKVVEKMTAEIPQVMFDNRVNEMMMDLEQRLAPQGITMEMYCQFTGQDIETVKKAYKDQAEKQVKLRLALEKIAQLENIEVTDDEATEEMQKIADQYKMKLDEVKKYISAEDVKKDIAVGKAVELVKDNAVIKEK
ncbi:MAG: trigger factor [Ruminococcus sp.]|nr:trigger factor [Ruminococcus sp.]